MVTKVIYLTTTGAGTWTVPSDWNPANNSVACIGGGGGAAAGQAGISGGRIGGGGGAYSKITNLPLTPGAIIQFNVGAPGVGGKSSNTNGTDGGDTWFGSASYASALVAAKGGQASTGSGLTNLGGAGGAASSGIGDVRYSGGTADPKASGGNGGTGGGGAGGPNGDGAASGTLNRFAGSGGGGSGGGSAGGAAASATGGAGGNNFAGTGGGAADGGAGTDGGGGGGSTVNGNVGGSGGDGAEWGSGYGSGGGGGGGSSDGTAARAGGNGGKYGGGGGGGANSGNAWSAGGDGGQGLIVITYEAITGVTVALGGVAASPAAGSPIATGGARANPIGVADDPRVGRIGTFGVLDITFIRSPDKAAQYLIEISAYQGSDFSSGGIETIGETPISSFPKGSGVDAGPVALSYADRDWIGDPSDIVNPHVFYEGRAVSPLTMEAQAPLYPENERRVQRQFGLIELINSDGVFDQLTRALSVDGRPVTVRLGPYMGAYSDFTIIAQMLGTAWQLGEDSVALAVQDQAYTLDLPIQSSLYEGTGGIEGTADIAGKPKPLCYGQVVNITPAFIDPLNLIYQVHDSAIESIDAVYDRGGQITLDASVGTGGDVANYAALVSASVGASKFATCKAQGLFKLGSSPAGIITADVKGDKTAGVYTDTLDGIALRIFEDRSDIDPALIDAASFAQTATLAGTMGVYVSTQETPTGGQVISRIVGSVGGWWGAAIDGKVKAGRIRDPRLIEPETYLDAFDVLEIEPEQKPIPRWRQRVAYAPNYTIQRGEDLDVTVTDARRQFLTEPYAIVTKASSSLPVRHPMAIDPPVLETLLSDQAAAQTVADALQDLFGVEREILRIKVKRIGLIINLGACISLTYPRFGLNTGRNFIVIGRAVDADRQEVELRLWG